MEMYKNNWLIFRHSIIIIFFCCNEQKKWTSIKNKSVYVSGGDSIECIFITNERHSQLERYDIETETNEDAREVFTTFSMYRKTMALIITIIMILFVGEMQLKW